MFTVHWKSVLLPDKKGMLIKHSHLCVGDGEKYHSIYQIQYPIVLTNLIKLHSFVMLIINKSYLNS
jgi:hypothetical protein